MGLALIIIGIVVALLLSWWIGIVLVIIGIVLLFVPHTYGYSDYRGRRGPPV
jgi:membrane protein implicated in regulation of membrane protease activity